MQNFKNPRNLQTDILFESMKETHYENKKVKKFFRVAIPVVILEILIVVALVTYLVLLPKSYCKISINHDDAIVYVNNKKTKRFRFDKPKQQTTFYHYPVDVCIDLPDGSDYLVTYTISCEDYEVFASTTATKQNNVYSLQVNNGEKTQIFSALTIKSSELLENFSIKVNIVVKNI